MLTTCKSASFALVFGLILPLARAWSTEPPPKLIEFGAGLSVPARPLPLPQWETPAPSGVAIEPSALPPTPVPAPASETTNPLEQQASRDIPASGSAPLANYANEATAGIPLVRKKMRFVVRGNRSLPADHIKTVLTPYIYGDDLEAACAALRNAYLSAGHLWVRVSVAPPTDYQVLFDVVEPRLRSMQVLPSEREISATTRTQVPGDSARPELRMTRGLRVIRSKSTH